MRRAIVTLLVLLSFGLKAQVYQAMPQAGYGPVKRMLFDSVLTIPLNINALRNITGGRDAGQIRYNVSDSGLYVFTGYTWIKANLDSVNLSNRINGKLNISDTAYMLSWYMRKTDTLSLSNRINLRVKYTDTAAMLDPYLRKLDTASLSRRIDEKQNIIKLTTNFKSGAATLIRDTLNIPKYSDTLQDNYVPYVGAIKDVDLGAYQLNANSIKSDYLLQVKNTPFSITPTSDYTSITPDKTGFVFYTSWLQGQSTYTQSNRFNYANQAQQNNTREYNLPVRNGTLALVEDTVNLSNRINLKADKATVLTINGVGYDLSANRTWTIPTFDSTSISNRINLKLNISDTAAMLSPYLRKADTSSLSNRIDLRVKYSDTAAMLSPYLKSAVTSVGLSMPSAFTVTNSPVTSTGTLTVTGAGNTSQYIDGTGALQTMQGIVTEVETLVKEVYNETGATLTKGTVVFINGGHGNLPTVTKAAASSDSLSAQTFGLVKADISDNSNGYVIVIGDLIDMPTSAFLEGTQLYLSPTAGLFTSTKQYAPSHLVYVGVVTRSHPTQGVISVKIQNGYEMDELHNVSAQSPSNNSLLQYKTSTNLWTKVEGTTSNIAEGTNLYYTDARVSNKMNYTDTASLSNRINAKADALSGTTNTVPKFTSSNTIGNSNIKDDGNVVSVSTTIGNFGALQVGSYNGNILMNTTNTNGGLIFQNTSSSNKLWDFSSDNNDLVFNESNVNPVMKLKAGGNVVISNLSGTGTRMVVADANGVLSSQAISNDTTSLSNRINLKLNISDTASMLSPYLRKADTSSLSNRINLKLNISDTASMLSGYQSAINSKQPQLNGTGFVKASGTTITYDNSTYYLASNPNGYTSNVGTVTSVAALTLGTSGTDLSSTVANGSTTPVITLNVPTASASNRGALSSADWTTFNNKASTAALSGYLPLTGGTLTNTLTTTGATNPLIIKGTNASTEWTEYYYNTSTLAGYIGNGSGILSGAANSDFIVRSESDFVVATGGNSRRLTIASTGAATFSSSVAATNSSTGFAINATSGYSATSNNPIITFGRAGSAVAGAIGYDDNLGSLYTGTTTGHNFLIKTNSATVATFTSGGNVGIGTTSPTGKLDVLSTYASDVTAQTVLRDNTGVALNFGGTASGFKFIQAQDAGGASTFYNLLLNPRGGNVGIGTASPATIFHINSPAATNATIYFGVNGTMNGYLGQSASSGSLSNGAAVGDVVLRSQTNLLFTSGGDGERMRIASGGSVVIGSTTVNTAVALQVYSSGTTSSTYPFSLRNSAGTDNFYIRSDGYGYLQASSWAYGSDRRMKENISDVENGLDMVLKMKPKHFDYINGQKDNLGFIAQDIQEIIPQAVSVSNQETGMLALKTDFLVPYLTKAIQELSVQIKDLQTEIQTLKNK